MNALTTLRRGLGKVHRELRLPSTWRTGPIGALELFLDLSLRMGDVADRAGVSKETVRKVYDRAMKLVEGLPTRSERSALRRQHVRRRKEAWSHRRPRRDLYQLLWYSATRAGLFVEPIRGHSKSVLALVGGRRCLVQESCQETPSWIISMKTVSEHEAEFLLARHAPSGRAPRWYSFSALEIERRSKGRERFMMYGPSDKRGRHVSPWGTLSE